MRMRVVNLDGSLAAAFALAAGAAAALAGPALADTVKLKSGAVIRGRVQDRGAYVIVEKDGDLPAPGSPGASLPTATARGSVRLERHEIASIELDEPSAAARVPKDLDVVVFMNGDELAGRVEVRAAGKEIIVLGRHGELVLDGRQVRTILWSKKAEEEQRSEAPGSGIAATIQRAIEDLRGAQAAGAGGGPEAAAARKGANERLYGLGVYALPYLEAHAEDPDPAVRAAIANVIEVARLKTYLTPALAERMPHLPRALVEGDEQGRLAALKEAIVAAPRDCAPILVHLARRDRARDVRAFVLSQLSLMDRTEELLELLDAHEGSLRFAAAVALGDTGVLVGVPLLIEALKMEEPALRRVAIQKLEKWTGHFLGYFADDAPEKRAAAARRWEEWWAKEGPALVERSLRATVRRDAISEDEKTEGLAHWTNAQLLWEKTAAAGIEGDERRREMHKVRFLLDKSLERWPQNAAARIALAVLWYTELGETDPARHELDLVLHRYAPDAGPTSRVHAHYHLGRIAQSEQGWFEAEKHLKLALAIDARNADVLRALGALACERALADATLDAPGRRGLFEDSVKRFTEGMASVDGYEMDLRENAEKAADAIATAQPFKRGGFLKSVDLAKLELRRAAADLRFLRGRSWAALQAPEKALADYGAALRLEPDNPLYQGAVRAWAPATRDPKDGGAPPASAAPGR